MSFDIIRQMILDSGMGYLATCEGDQPRVRAMMPIIKDDGRLLAATFPGMKKIARIEAVAEVSQDKMLKAELWNKQMMLRQFFSGVEDANFVLLVMKPTHIFMMNIGEKGYTEVKI
jgi:uncharacterized pyridoxamine 5'-phosphate oxidase family protein